ncbi:MAG: RagB/SusD family nutrient uptake outer membrane protein, partial [Bacteroidaceae bacterium]
MDTSKYQLAMNECEALMNNGYNDLIESSEQVQKTDEDGHLVVDDLGHPVMVTEYSGYRTLFLNYIQNNFDTKESIFEINYKYLRDKGLYTDGPYGCINGVSFSYGSAYSTGYPSSYAFVNASPLLYNTYAQNDKRRSWNIAEFTYDKDGDVRRVISAMATNFNPAKYRRWEPTDMADIDIPLTSEQKANGEIEPYTVLEDNSILSKNFSCVNFPVIRFADILLMYAEASNEVNGAPTTEGIAALNRVRQRANLEAIETVSPEKVASHDAFLSEIQDERMRELCFEGLRRQDLIRWGIYGERLNVLANQIKGDSNFSESDAQSNAYLRTSDNFDATKNLSLPYPDQEVKLNNLLEQKAEWK